jgi:hypothetical protein
MVTAAIRHQDKIRCDERYAWLKKQMVILNINGDGLAISSAEASVLLAGFELYVKGIADRAI